MAKSLVHFEANDQRNLDRRIKLLLLCFLIFWLISGCSRGGDSVKDNAPKEIKLICDGESSVVSILGKKRLEDQEKISRSYNFEHGLADVRINEDGNSVTKRILTWSVTIDGATTYLKEDTMNPEKNYDGVITEIAVTDQRITFAHESRFSEGLRRTKVKRTNFEIDRLSGRWTGRDLDETRVDGKKESDVEIRYAHISNYEGQCRRVSENKI